MARSRGVFHRGRPQRRKTGWDFGPGGTGVTSFSSSTTSILGGGAEVVAQGLTLVRLRGSVQGFLKTADAANAGFHCAMGIGIVSTDAFAVGVTALPNPADDIGWGWLYHRFFDLHAFSATVADSMAASGLGSIQFEVDSKAMRKLTVSEVIFASLQVIELSTATMSVFFESRALLKLP